MTAKERGRYYQPNAFCSASGPSLGGWGWSRGENKMIINRGKERLLEIKLKKMVENIEKVILVAIIILVTAFLIHLIYA